MRRRLVPFVAFASVICCTLWGVWLKAEPETVDARSIIPGSAWVYMEYGPGSGGSWKDYLFGGLPEKDRAEAEKKLDELWTEFEKAAAKESGMDVATFLKEIDRVHIALLDFDIVQMERKYGNGPAYEVDRPEADMVAVVKCRTKGYWTKLLDGDFKEYVKPGPEYRNRKTWVLDTHAAEAERELKTVSTLHLAAVGDTVLLSNVRASLEKLLDAVDGTPVAGGPISANADFQRAQKQAGPNAMFIGYVNLRSLLEAVEGSLERSDLEEYQMVDAVLGQSTMRSAVIYGGLDKRYGFSGASLFLDAKNELWSLIRQEPAKKDLLRVIPADSVGAVVFTLHEPAAMWAKMRSFIVEKEKLFSPERPEFEKGLSEIESGLGVSIDDILGVVDDEVGWAGFVAGDNRFDEKSQVVFVEVKDEAKAKVIIESIKSSEAFKENAQVSSIEYEGYTLYTIEGGEVPLGYVFLGKVFVLTFDGATQKALVDAYKAGKVLENDQRFKDSMKGLPAENSKLVYCNLGHAIRLAAEATREVDPEVAEKLQGEQGMAMVTVEKADEATLKAGCELNSEYYARLVMQAMPMVEEARENAIVTRCAGNLRSISSATAVWVNDFGDSRDYPMTLEVLSEKQLIPAGFSRCPNPKAQKSEYVYMYPPKGFGTGMDFILVYDNELHSNGKRSVLYFSGRVEALDEESFSKVFEEQLKALPDDIEAAIVTTKDAAADAEGDKKEELEKKVKFLEEYKKDVEAKAKERTQK